MKECINQLYIAENVENVDYNLLEGVTPDINVSPDAFFSSSIDAMAGDIHDVAMAMYKQYKNNDAVSDVTDDLFGMYGSYDNLLNPIDNSSFVVSLVKDFENLSKTVSAIGPDDINIMTKVINDKENYTGLKKLGEIFGANKDDEHHLIGGGRYKKVTVPNRARKERQLVGNTQNLDFNYMFHNGRLKDRYVANMTFYDSESLKSSDNGFFNWSYSSDLRDPKNLGDTSFVVPGYSQLSLFYDKWADRKSVV